MTHTAFNADHSWFKQLFELSPDPAWIIDDNRFIECNEAAIRALGYINREEFLNVHPAKLSPPRQPDGEDSYVKAERMMALAKDHGIHRFEWMHTRADGMNFVAEVTLSAIELRNRQVIYCVWRDITERKQAEQELVESEARFRGLVEQSIAGIYIIQDGKFSYVNPRFAEIRGYGSADEIIGCDISQLIAEKDRGPVAEHNRRLLAGEVPSIDYSLTGLRKDGSSLEISVHSSPASYRGRPAIIGLQQDISEKIRAEKQISQYIAQLENTFMQVVEVATILSEMRDPYTAGHERRVAEIAVAIGAELGFDARRQEGLRVAGYLHDIGKINIPSEILSKPGKLTAIEFKLIKEHAQSSFDVLKGLEFPWPVAAVALQHHERIDGSGYPQGLKGGAILLEARIMAVADVVEAMTTHRPYRAGLGLETALAEIERGRGTAYDPQIADACLKLFREKGYTIPA